MENEELELEELLVDDDEDEAVMHLIFDDGHEDKIFFDMVLLDAV